MTKGLAPTGDNPTPLRARKKMYLGECSNIEIGIVTPYDDIPHEHAWTVFLLQNVQTRSGAYPVSY
jgi:hypothetical protein